jgi:hypothetical protein
MSDINGGRAMAAAAAEGRSSFVDYVLNQFVARKGAVVTDEVRDYILQRVIAPDDVWNQGLANRRFVPESVAKVLTEALEAATYENKDLRDVDLSHVEDSFHQVIDGNYNCSFPFIIC